MDEVDEDEFEYTPLNAKCDDHNTNKKNDNTGAPLTDGEGAGQQEQSADVAPPLPFKNDGSFLEMMKQKMEKESSSSKESRS